MGYAYILVQLWVPKTYVVHKYEGIHTYGFIYIQPAYTLEENDYLTIKEQLHKSLKTKSAFQHGLGIRLTKLDDTPATDSHSAVQVTLHRTPMSKESGLVPREQVGMSMTELSRLNGADAATKVNTASGFEGE